MSKDTLSVNGCIFNPSMRTICSLLELNDIQFNCEDTNMFERDAAQESSQYQSMDQNPSLCENGQTILGDGPSLFKYLCLTQRKNKKGQMVHIDERFIPRQKANADRKKTIINLLEYNEHMVHINGAKITKLVIQKLLQKQGKGGSNAFDEMDLANEAMIFFDIILTNLESQIADENSINVSEGNAGKAFEEIKQLVAQGEIGNSPAPVTKQNFYINK